MPQKTRTIFNTILLVILIIITFLLIFKDYDLKTTLNLIIHAKAIYLCLAFMMMLLYFVFISLTVKKVMEALGEKISLGKMFKYTIVGFFFSGVTPGGSGGQPMQIYYMRKENIAVSSSTIALIMHLCAYHIMTIILGFVGLIVNYNLITKQFMWIFIVGLLLKLFVLSLTLILLFSKKITELLVNIVVKLLRFIKYKKTEEVHERIKKALVKYHQGADFIKNHKIIFCKSLLYVSLQAASLYAITFFVYRALGLQGVSLFKIMSIQALLLVSTSSIPIPGAVGISESVYLSINETIFGKKYLASALILNRGINFYLFMFISFLLVIRITFKKTIKE